MYLQTLCLLKTKMSENDKRLLELENAVKDLKTKREFDRQFHVKLEWNIRRIVTRCQKLERRIIELQKQSNFEAEQTGYIVKPKSETKSNEGHSMA